MDMEEMRSIVACHEISEIQAFREIGGKPRLREVREVRVSRLRSVHS